MLSLFNLISEVFKIVPTLRLSTDASACRGMLLRHGVGKVKHLSVKQLWSQEVVQCFGVQVDRIPRAENPADLLTHSVSFPVAEGQLARLHMYRDGLGGREPARAISFVETHWGEDKRRAARGHSSTYSPESREPTLLSLATVADTSSDHCSQALPRSAVAIGASPISATELDAASSSRGGVQMRPPVRCNSGMTYKQCSTCPRATPRCGVGSS